MFRFIKTKAGFTLVELLVVVLIIGIVVAIGIPTYQGITKGNRAKLCGVARREVLAELRDWCNNTEFNEDYTFTITSDGTKGTVVAEPLKKEVKEDGVTKNKTLIDTDIIIEGILDKDIPFCPSGGTITVVVTQRLASVALIEISCNGGKDGKAHE